MNQPLNVVTGRTLFLAPLHYSPSSHNLQSNIKKTEYSFLEIYKISKLLNLAVMNLKICIFYFSYKDYHILRMAGELIGHNPVSGVTVT